MLLYHTAQWLYCSPVELAAQVIGTSPSDTLLQAAQLFSPVADTALHNLVAWHQLHVSLPACHVSVISNMLLYQIRASRYQLHVWEGTCQWQSSWSLNNMLSLRDEQSKCRSTHADLTCKACAPNHFGAVTLFAQSAAVVPIS